MVSVAAVTVGFSQLPGWQPARGSRGNIKAQV